MAYVGLSLQLVGFHLAFLRRKIFGKMLNFPPVFSKLIYFKIENL